MQMPSEKSAGSVADPFAGKPGPDEWMIGFISCRSLVLTTLGRDLQAEIFR